MSKKRATKMTNRSRAPTGVLLTSSKDFDAQGSYSFSHWMHLLKCFSVAVDVRNPAFQQTLRMPNSAISFNQTKLLVGMLGRKKIVPDSFGPPMFVCMMSFWIMRKSTSGSEESTNFCLPNLQISHIGMTE